MPNLTKRRRQLRELSQRTAANRRRAAQGLSQEEHSEGQEHEEEGESEMEEGEGEGEGEGEEEDEEREEEEKEQRKEDSKQHSQQQREESEEVEHTRSRTRTRTHTTAHTHTRAHTHTHAEEESAGEESAAHSASSARSSAAHTRKRSYTRRQSEGKSEKTAHSETQQRAPVYTHNTSQSTTNTQSNGASASAEVDERAWVQCNDCGKWRALPSTVDTEALPEIWTCAMNTHDPQRNNCDAAEENYSKDEEPEQNVALKAFLRLWMNKMYFAERAEKTAGTVTRARKRKQDVDWIQCSNPACGKWRAIAKGIDTTAMLKKLHKRRAMGEELRWFCTMNSWDDSQASCTAPQEPLWDCPWNLTAEDA